MERDSRRRQGGAGRAGQHLRACRGARRPSRRRPYPRRHRRRARGCRPRRPRAGRRAAATPPSRPESANGPASSRSPASSRRRRRRQRQASARGRRGRIGARRRTPNSERPRTRRNAEHEAVRERKKRKLSSQPWRSSQSGRARWRPGPPRSLSTLRSSPMFERLSPFMRREYDVPFVRAAALMRTIQRRRKSRFLRLRWA